MLDSIVRSLSPSSRTHRLSLFIPRPTPRRPAHKQSCFRHVARLTALHASPTSARPLIES